MTTTAWIIGSIIAVLLIVVLIEYLFRRSEKQDDCKKLKNKLSQLEAEHKKDIMDMNSKLERIYNLVKK